MYLLITCKEFAPENIVIVAGIYEKFVFLGYIISLDSFHAPQLGVLKHLIRIGAFSMTWQWKPTSRTTAEAPWIRYRHLQQPGDVWRGTQNVERFQTGWNILNTASSNRTGCPWSIAVSSGAPWPFLIIADPRKKASYSFSSYIYKAFRIN